MNKEYYFCQGIFPTPHIARNYDQWTKNTTSVKEYSQRDSQQQKWKDWLLTWGKFGNRKSPSPSPVTRLIPSLSYHSLLDLDRNNAIFPISDCFVLL